jgi:hypothetical protein
MLREVNHTHIALIHKIDYPSKVHQFRPITPCNFNYKIISKNFINCLKALLSKIISSTQSSFIKGRSIHDNFILAHEIFHTMKHKKGRGSLKTIKQDPTMVGSYLLKILSLLGFNDNLLSWIE